MREALYIVLIGQFPSSINMEHIVHRLGVDQGDLPAKVEVGWRQSGAGRSCGSAGPRVPPLAPPFVLDTARWAPNLCMSVPGFVRPLLDV